MSELGEYRRLVEQPMIADYEATIASLRAEIERSQDALQQLVDYIKDGCPDDGQYYVMTEAQAALKGIKVVQPASPLPAVGGEALTQARNLVSGFMLPERITDPVLADDLALAIAALIAAQPASPLRGRESVREIAHRHCTCTCRGDPEVLQNHTNLCDEISDAILEYAVLSSAAPEQPAASPVTGRELTENERDAIAHAKYQCDCSSPSDPEVRFDYEVIRTLLSLIPVRAALTLTERK